eukprot:GEZU01013332.1.p1 GENE.GEZU01013332.1~~GEZU01013332.1.p1  ORF type:complete len:158 (-),score=28.36 GEZU01013332.1:146-619(-)
MVLKIHNVIKNSAHNYTYEPTEKEYEEVIEEEEVTYEGNEEDELVNEEDEQPEYIPQFDAEYSTAVTTPTHLIHRMGPGVGPDSPISLDARSSQLDIEEDEGLFSIIDMRFLIAFILISVVLLLFKEELGIAAYWDALTDLVARITSWTSSFYRSLL